MTDSLKENQITLFAIVDNVLHICENKEIRNHLDWFKARGWMETRTYLWYNSIVRGHVDTKGIHIYFDWNNRTTKKVEEIFISKLFELVFTLDLFLWTFVNAGEGMGQSRTSHKQLGSVYDVIDKLIRTEPKEANKYNYLYRYPYNLILRSRVAGTASEVLQFNLKKFLAVVEGLKETYKKIIELRYIRKLTLESCGKHLKVTKTTVQQREKEMLRAIRARHWEYFNEENSLEILEDRYKKVVALSLNQKREINQLKDKNSYLTNEYVKMCSQNEKKRDSINVSTVDTALTKLTEIGLSNKACKVLRNANKRYVSDVVGMTRSGLLRLRNLGVKTADEIIECLASYGFTIKD